MKKLLLLIFCSIFLKGVAQEPPTPEMIRTGISQGVQSLEIQPEVLHQIENILVDSIPVRIYYPSVEKNLPIVYNVHGGAFVAGDLETHENISRKIANAANAIVIALDYRKPPEYPFPKSINDVYTVYTWILNNRTEIGGNTDPISVICDSGGAILTSALQVKLHELGEKSQIEKAVYINPAFDLRNPGPYALVTNWYLSGADPDEPLASPIMAKDFSIFCPSLIVVNEKDILRQHGIDFGFKLDDSEIPNELYTIKGEDHFGVYWAGAHPKVNDAFEKCIAFLMK